METIKPISPNAFEDKRDAELLKMRPGTDPTLDKI